MFKNMNRRSKQLFRDGRLRLLACISIADSYVSCAGRGHRGHQEDAREHVWQGPHAVGQRVASLRCREPLSVVARRARM